MKSPLDRIVPLKVEVIRRLRRAQIVGVDRAVWIQDFGKPHAHVCVPRCPAARSAFHAGEVLPEVVDINARLRLGERFGFRCRSTRIGGKSCASIFTGAGSMICARFQLTQDRWQLPLPTGCLTRSPGFRRRRSPSAECTTVAPASSHRSPPTPRSRPYARCATAPAAPAASRHNCSAAGTTPAASRTIPARAMRRLRSFPCTSWSVTS